METYRLPVPGKEAGGTESWIWDLTSPTFEKLRRKRVPLGRKETGGHTDHSSSYARTQEIASRLFPDDSPGGDRTICGEAGLPAQSCPERLPG